MKPIQLVLFLLVSLAAASRTDPNAQKLSKKGSAAPANGTGGGFRGYIYSWWDYVKEWWKPKDTTVILSNSESSAQELQETRSSSSDLSAEVYRSALDIADPQAEPRPDTETAPSIFDGLTTGTTQSDRFDPFVQPEDIYDMGESTQNSILFDSFIASAASTTPESEERVN